MNVAVISDNQKDTIREYKTIFSGDDLSFFTIENVKNSFKNSFDIYLISVNILQDHRINEVKELIRGYDSKKLIFLYADKQEQINFHKREGYDGFIFLNGNNTIADDTFIHKAVIKTFGTFEITINGKVIEFTNKKSKELLALCIDKRGHDISSRNAAQILWSERMFDTNVCQLYRKAARELSNILQKEGFPDLFVRKYGTCRINTKYLDCDLYRFFKKPSYYVSLFDYLPDYEWAESTRAEIFEICDRYENIRRYVCDDL